MGKYRVAVLPGDGVGKEVIDAAMIVLKKLKLDAEYRFGDIGWEFWCKEGNPLPDRTINLLRDTDVCLFGAITSKPKEEADKELAPELKNRGLIYTSPIITLRQTFQLHTNMRPCKAYPGNPLNLRDDIDLVVFRENTEGLYVGIEYHPMPDTVRETLEASHPKMKTFGHVPSDDMAVSLRIITRKGARNIVQQAFEYARRHGYASVTLVEKPNVLRETSGMMLREARGVASAFPEIELWETNIDAMTMWLVKNPQDYAVIVTSNMFGDILSDLAAQLVGGLGFASTGNIGDSYAIFEPSHGSAPKYAGQYKVNPIAMLLTAKLMLDYLGEIESAERLESAVAGVIKDGETRTYDMGGTHGTLEVAEAVAGRL